MATIRSAQRVGVYTATDGLWIAALGIVGGLLNTLVSSTPHAHAMLWSAQVPYASFFTLAPVIAMLLVRKPGTALATALVVNLMTALLKSSPTTLLFGVTEGLGAEAVFALFRYRRFDALTAFLAGGVGAKTLDNLWAWIHPTTSSPMMRMMAMTHYAGWQTFIGAELLALVVVGILSGLMGWAFAKAIARVSGMASLRPQRD